MAAYYDPKTKAIIGIYCDLCNQVYIDKFEYFSGHFDLVEVDKSVGKAGIKQIDRRYVDVDVCKSCMEKLKQQMLDNIKKREQGGDWEVK